MTLDTVHKRLNEQDGPLSVRLRNAFASAIEDGTLPADFALPPERDLALRLGVSRSTLRRCLTELARQGLVRTRRGAGTIVSSRIPKALTRLSGFTEDIRASGGVPTSEIVECSIAPVLPDVARRTGLPPGTEMLTLARLRRADGEALSYEIAVVPVWTVGRDYDGSGSLYDRMETTGSRPRRILQTLEAVGASPEIARRLGVPTGTPTLHITQTGFGADGRAVEDAISWYRGDRYRYVGEIEG